MSTFYKVDSARLSLRECWFFSPRWEFPVHALLRLLRVRMPCSTGNPPCVEAIAPYEVEEAELPDEERELFEPLRKELESLGFGRPIYHSIYVPHSYTHIYWATFTHHTGRALARIHHRVWNHPTTFRSRLFPVFITELEGGSYLVSTGERRGLSAPDSVRMHYQTGASATSLWDAHRQRLDELYAGQAKRVFTEDESRALTERLHGLMRDFHMARGVFQPLGPGEQASAAPVTAPGQDRDDQVLAQLERLQKNKSSWLSFAVILVVSGLLFFGAQRLGELREFGWLLIPVLLFHELGHYAAMRLFGYRNVRMFFIPFLGAAVTGKNFNVAGWKKAVVALLGPVPGIALGAGLGVAGLLLRRPALTDASLLLLIVNGFNLVPLLPFDGGWVLHATLFCRHPVLDTAARALAVVAIVGLGLLLHSRLYLLAIPLALALPASWRVARVADRLRQRGRLAASDDGVTVPPEAARAILAELRADRPTPQPANLLAQRVLGVFENLNARPPGVPATLALLAVHAGGFLAAVVLAVVFTAGRMGVFDRWHSPRRDPTPHAYTAGTSREWRGANVPATPGEASFTLAATFADEAAARDQFDALPAELPPDAAMRLFGRTLLLTFPADRGAERSRWGERLRPRARELAGQRAKTRPMVNFSCRFESEEEAQEMERQLRVYFERTSEPLLLPPWSAAWRDLPAAEREGYQKARRSLARLHEVPRQASQQPEVTALSAEIVKAFRSKDWAERRRLADAQQKARHAAEERLLAELLADEKDSVDPSLVELWRREQQLYQGNGPDGADGRPREARAADRLKEIARLQVEKARRLGALPLQGDVPRPGSDGDGANRGWVVRNGSAVTVSGVVFLHPHGGLPALADWLGERAVPPVRYGIDNEDEDDDQ
jgi:Zn-dependent protease